MLDFNGQEQQRGFWSVIQYEGTKSVVQIGKAADSTGRDGAGEVIFARQPNGPVLASVFGSIRSGIRPAADVHELGERYVSPFRFEYVCAPQPPGRISWSWETGVHYLAIGAELSPEKPAE